MAPITVRPMRADELDAVIVLWHETSADTYTFIEAERNRQLDDRRGYFLANIASRCRLHVALDGETMCGFLAMADSYIDRLYVHPGMQRRGVGEALLGKARELCPAGLEVHTHQANRRACAFYEKHGFLAVRYGVSPPPENEPDVEYHWRPA